MRHDHNSWLWTTAPRRPSWRHRLAYASVAVMVAAIATVSIRDQMAPPGFVCTQAWPSRDAGCGEKTAAQALRPVRVIGIDRNAAAIDAPAVVAKAVPVEAAPAIEPVAAVPLPNTPPSASAAPSPAATDGAGGRTATVVDRPPVVAAAPISDEDLTFKTGAAHRPGATVAAKDATAVEPPRKTKPRRNAAQTHEFTDGRRVTVPRGYREAGDPNGWRLRAADVGRRFQEPDDGSFGGRREPRGVGGLY